MNSVRSAFLVAAALFLRAAASPPPPRPAQIILLRHAEKPDDPANPHLTAAGVARAERLVSFIQHDPAATRFGPPVALFATATTKDDDGQRTQETLAPLSKALKLAVQTPYHGKDYLQLAKMILGNPLFNGRTIVICWNHEEIPQLAAALGATQVAPKWKGSVFDQIYVISYQGRKAILNTARYGDR